MQLWQLCSTNRWSLYTCPECGGNCEIRLRSRAICVLMVSPLVEKRSIRLLLVLPLALGGAYLLGFLLTRSGTFRPLPSDSRHHSSSGRCEPLCITEHSDLTRTCRSINLSASVDINGLIESGGGTGPAKPRQPTQGASLSDQVPNPARPKNSNREKMRRHARVLDPLLSSMVPSTITADIFCGWNQLAWI